MSEDKNLKDAQYRKSLSIAFFNATNAAIEIVKAGLTRASKEEIVHPDMDATVKRQVTFWRDWLLEEHREYYGKTIANVGVAYRAEETIKVLKTAKTVDELRQKWLNLSEDERRDGEIIKCIEEMKLEFAKQPAKVEAKKVLAKKQVTKPNEKPRQHKAGQSRVAPNPKG